MLNLYHGTNQQFTAFQIHRPTFFFLDPREARALIRTHFQGNGRILHTSLEPDDRLATASQALRHWNKANPSNPANEYLYSMLCWSTNEFPLRARQRFVQRLFAKGYSGVAYLDYSQVNMDKDASAVVLLNAKPFPFTVIE